MFVNFVFHYTDPTMKKISILIPCYNEEKTLPLLYPELVKLMEGIPADE